MNKVISLIFLIFLQSNIFADHIYLIPGAASSSGDIYIKNVSWIIKALHKDNYFSYFLKNLKAENYSISICPQAADKDQSTLEEREKECVKNILESKKCNIHLIGHSLGGLVAKKVSTNPKIKKCIKSVTSISSPHLGTAFADRALRVYYKEQKGIIMERQLYDLTGFNPQNIRYLKELTIKERESKKPRKSAHVDYYSIVTKSEGTLNPLLMFSSKLLSKELKNAGKDTQNDGIVPTHSMYDGTLLGEFEADHWESACINVLVPTKGCLDVYNALSEHLKSIYKN